MRITRTLAVLAAVSLLTGCAWIDRSSVSSAPGRVEGNARSYHPSVSQSGRWVAFASDASNLVPGDTNGVSDVFVRDHVTNQTERVSLTDDGLQNEQPSIAPSISDDGRFVALETKFVDPRFPESSRQRISIRDRVLDTTTTSVLTADSSGHLFGPQISGNGQYVAFLGEDGLGGRFGPYVRDVAAATTRAMPLNGGVESSVAFSEARPSLSDDGKRIAYGYLVPPAPGGTGSYASVVADTTTATIIATVDAGPIPEPFNLRFESAISGDGTKVVLARTGADSLTDVFLYDLSNPGLTPVVEDVANLQSPKISDDGGRIGYRSGSEHFVINMDGTTSVVSADIYGNSVTAGWVSDLSGDGLWVAFSSSDPSLVGSDRNGTEDVFLRSISTFDTLATPYTCGHGVRPGPCDPP